VLKAMEKITFDEGIGYLPVEDQNWVKARAA
jgi:hypothetical protein